jgi:hypothetical protein
MMPYILHVTAITTVCFLFYKLLLQKETFYRLNRWTLMGCLAVAFSLPLLPVPRDWSWRERWAAKPVAPEAVDASVVPPAVVDAPVVPSAVADAPVAPPVVAKVDEPWPDEDYSRARGDAAASPAPAPEVPPGRVAGAAQVFAVANPTGKAAVANPTGKAPVANPTGKAAVANPTGDAAVPVDRGVVVLQWLFYLYAIGLILFGGNFFLQILILLYHSYRRPAIRDGMFRIVEIAANRAPCSFGNTIFINPANYDWETYNQILIHEKVHISGRHTLDILLAEMAVVLQWFNPFVWLYRREVENNLEFLTDASVLRHREVDRSAYQLSLLRVSAPHLPFSITNNYNQSLLKRRIVMMNSKRSSSHTVWKYFFLIPLLTGLVCALNKPAALGADRKKSPFVRTSVSGREEHPVASLLQTATNPLNWLLPMIMDTSRKPGTDSSRSAHGNQDGSQRPALSMDSLSGSQRPALSMDSLSGSQRPALLKDSLSGSKRFELSMDSQSNPKRHLLSLDGPDAEWGSRSTEEKMALDQALQNVHINGDILMDVKDKIKEKMVLSGMAQLDMMNRELAVQQAKGLVDKQALVAADQMAKFNLDLSKQGLQTDIGVNIGDIRMPSDSEMMEGAWFATSFPGDEKIKFEMKRESENGNWNSSFGVSKSEFNPYPGQGNVDFKLVRDGGTVDFKGQFDGQEGFGHFRFTANEAYFNDLKKMGLAVDGRRFAYFTMNIKKDYVAMLQRYFPHLEDHDVFASAANHLQAEDIKYWQGAGLAGMDNPRTVITLQKLHIDRAYVDELKAAGYDHLEPRELIVLKSRHIDGAYIASLRKIGYGNLELNQLVSLYNQHITADFIKGFQAIGYKELSVRDVTTLKVSGITPEYIKTWRDLGYEDTDAHRLASLKAQGITPEFVREFNKIGFDHIPVNMLGLLKSTGVNAEYVSKMKEKGFVSKDLTKYIRLKSDFN